MDLSNFVKVFYRRATNELNKYENYYGTIVNINKPLNIPNEFLHREEKLSILCHSIEVTNYSTIRTNKTIFTKTSQILCMVCIASSSRQVEFRIKRHELIAICMPLSTMIHTTRKSMNKLMADSIMNALRTCVFKPRRTNTNKESILSSFDLFARAMTI